MINYVCISEKVYKDNKPYGYITLEQSYAHYEINMYLYDTGIIDLCIDTRKCNTYDNALNVFGIMRNKYNK